MDHVTISVELEEKVYRTLARYATMVHRDVSAIVGELLTEQLAELTLRMEAERIRALPLAERRAIARGAWGSWNLGGGLNSVELVRHLRAEWAS